MKWLWFFFSFRGRISRKPYLIFLAVTVAVVFLIAILIEIPSKNSESLDTELLIGGLLLLISWPTLAVHVKRWHDRNRNAWWFLVITSPLGAIPFYVAIWVLIECALLPGTPGENRFGSTPNGNLLPTGNTDRYQPALVTLLICLFIITSSIAGYRIPSGAMMPTFLVGDFIIANKAMYGIPMPFTKRSAIPTRNPAQGDVIVFRFPPNPSVEYIMRVVGEPGDRITYFEKQIYVNGEKLPQTEIGIYTGEGSGASQTGALLRKEQKEDIEHYILIHLQSPDFKVSCDEMEGYEIAVPSEHYFVLGDNRDNSNDSRCWGFVPRGNVIGKAMLVWMNWDSRREGFPVKFSRVGKLLH